MYISHTNFDVWIDKGMYVNNRLRHTIYYVYSPVEE